MADIAEILKSDKKPKEKVTLLAEKIKSNKKALAELIKCFDGGSDGDKGNCIEAIEYVTIKNPEFGAGCIDFVIEQLDNKAPRVKWEAARIIGNVAKKFPKETSKATPKLLANTKDKGTVVRWSAAFALTEVAKNNPGVQSELIPVFEKLVKTEESGGVKNIYAKAIKALKK